MSRRQTVPEQWLIFDRRPTRELWRTIRALPRGSGVLIIGEPTPKERRRLRQRAVRHELIVVREGSGAAARVHNARELRQALLHRTSLILISPIYQTPSHPDWPSMPRMRAATLARLANRRAIALGGMNRRRYAKVAPLGFIGWAGISAFRT
jgi:thiamine-phosphate pyrophosphorylase